MPAGAVLDVIRYVPPGLREGSGCNFGLRLKELFRVYGFRGLGFRVYGFRI